MVGSCNRALVFMGRMALQVFSVLVRCSFACNYVFNHDDDEYISKTVSFTVGGVMTSHGLHILRHRAVPLLKMQGTSST
jgi:hypothetical protein